MDLQWEQLWLQRVLLTAQVCLLSSCCKLVLSLGPFDHREENELVSYSAEEPSPWAQLSTGEHPHTELYQTKNAIFTLVCLRCVPLRGETVSQLKASLQYIIFVASPVCPPSLLASRSGLTCPPLSSSSFRSRLSSISPCKTHVLCHKWYCVLVLVLPKLDSCHPWQKWTTEVNICDRYTLKLK